MKLRPLFAETGYPTDALIARVAAGEPLEIGDEFEQIDLNYMLARGNPYAMLVRVRGDSMSDEIHDGDWILIDRSLEPRPGQTVLARIENGFTVKRLEVDSNGRRKLYLVPANDIHRTQEIDEHDGFEVIGTVTHIIRNVT